MTGWVKIVSSPGMKVGAVLVFGIGTILYLGWLTFGEPFPADVQCYASVARGMREGLWLYADFFDNKPPGIFLAYWVSTFWGEPARVGINSLAALALLGTLLGVFEAGRVFSDRTSTGLWAAFFYAGLCQAPGLWGNLPLPETFMNLFGVWAFAFFLRGLRTPGSWGWVWLSGLFWGSAACFKPTVLVTPGLFVAYLALREGLKGLRKPWASGAGRGMVVLLVALIPLSLMTLYFIAHGKSREFLFWMVDFNHYYVGHLGANLWDGLRIQRLFPSHVLFLIPWLFAVLMGTFYARVNPLFWGLGCAWMVSVWFQVSASGRFFNYYYLLWLPPCLVLSAWGLETLRKAGRPQVAMGVGIVLTLIVLTRTWGQVSLPLERWVEATNVFTPVDGRRIASQIRALLGPGDKYFEWTTEPTFYAEVGQVPPTPLLYGYNLTRGYTYRGRHFDNPLSDEQRLRVLEDLDRVRPLIVVEDRVTRPDEPVLQRYLDTHYRFVGLLGEGERFRIFRRVKP